MLYDVDLHIHTNASNDGSVEPKEIVEMAMLRRMKMISIADHNTCRGSLEASRFINESGIKELLLIPGIEIDCSYNGVNLHVLGYGIDASREEFREHERYMTEMELEAGVKRKAAIEKVFQIELDEDNIKKHAGSDIMDGEYIAEELLTNPKYDGIEQLDGYRAGGERSDNPYLNFYWDYCSQGKVAYVPMEFISLDAAVDMIRKTGGIAVLAHPGNNVHEDEELLRQILSRGIEAVEAISSYHSREQVDYYLAMADKYHVSVTCGSDYHGKIKPTISMGEFDYEFDSENIKACKLRQ